MAGIGPATSPLPRECSTTEPHGRLSLFKHLALQHQIQLLTTVQFILTLTNVAANPNFWSGRRGSNSRHSVWKTEALPTELHPHSHQINVNRLNSNALCYKNVLCNKLIQTTKFQKTIFWWRGKDSNLRTQRERIYSPSPLTTRPPLLTEPAIMLIF